TRRRVDLGFEPRLLGAEPAEFYGDVILAGARAHGVDAGAWPLLAERGGHREPFALLSLLDPALLLRVLERDAEEFRDVAARVLRRVPVRGGRGRRVDGPVREPDLHVTGLRDAEVFATDLLRPSSEFGDLT